jgi:hypothetical protein
MTVLVIPSPLTAVGIESIVQVSPGGALMARASWTGRWITDSLLRRVLD